MLVMQDVFLSRNVGSKGEIIVFVYRIEFENYEGEYFIELYHHEANAKARFEELRTEAKNKPEFDSHDENENYYYGFSFFDADYNEYSTFITLERIPYERLFEDRA